MIRKANKSDLSGLRELICAATSPDDLLRAFNVLERAEGGVLVAFKAAMIGCIAWQAIRSLQDPPIGRVTLLLVAEDERRRGIGRRLLDAAMATMARKGCRRFEAMSDIEIRNVNGFYRALGFEQRSYRFVRDVVDD